MYWVLSGTLLNHAFYTKILSRDKVVTSFYNASRVISGNSLITMSTQSIRNNFVSLLDGLIRYITLSDMTLSDISIEDNAISLKTDFLPETYNVSSGFPKISSIHPYALTYFIPESNNIYWHLSLFQKGYAIYRFFSPVFFFIALLIVLFSKRVPENLHAILISTSTAVCFTGLFLLIFQKPMLIIPLSKALGVYSSFLKPFIAEICLLIFIKIIELCFVFIIVALLTKIEPITRFIKKSARNIALILIIFAGIFSILYRNEIYSVITPAVNNTMGEHKVYTIDQHEGTVHSLTIKLKEEETNEPVSDVHLVLLKTDYSYRVTALSDVLGNARFILPQGEFFIYADQSTVPDGFISFEPVIIALHNPDSSWYTFYLKKSNEENFTLETQNQQISDSPDPPLP